MAASDRAVVVGISRYPGLDDLAGTENDANDFTAWLKDPQGGDVPEANITSILSSHFPVATDPLDAQPTTEALEKTFLRLWQQGLDASDGKVGRRLYLFLAGHGFAPDLNSAALLMANAARTSPGLHIAGPPYADRFRQAGFFDEVVLLMDCCRENYPQAPRREPPFLVTTAPKIGTYFYGFATTFSRAAREEAAVDGRVGGIFTRTVLAGLRGAAQDPTGVVTGESLAAYVYNALRAGSAAPASTRQDPEFRRSDQPPLVFVAAPAAPPLFRVRVTVGTPGAGPAQLVDGTLKPVPPASTADGVMEWSLPPGLYEVGLAGGPPQPLRLIGPGGTVDVAL